MAKANNLKEYKTTAVGLIVWLATGAYFTLPYYHTSPLWEVNQIYVGCGVIAGAMLLLAPDRFVNFVFGWLKKK